jgi:hypothetical protein
MGAGPVTRVALLLVLCASLGSGCVMSSRQEVFIAAPAQTFLFFTGGRQETYCTFDLSTSPRWRDQHGKLARVQDLAIIGDFLNTTGVAGGLPVPIEVKLIVAPDPLPSFNAGVETWGALEIDVAGRRRIDWSEGKRLMLAGASTLQGEIRGDGKFTLYTVTTPQVTLNGGVTVENLRVAAVFELK